MSTTLNFLGGAPFQLLYDGVKLAISNSSQFKIQLRSLKFTLDCLQPHIIEQIRLQNLQLNLSIQEIQELQSKIDEGIVLVGRLSSLNTWNICIWGNCCNCVTPGYADQLDELNESLRRLLEILRLQSIAQVNQIVILSRTARERQDELGRRQLEILSNQRDIIDTLRKQRQVIERIERNGVAASTTREEAVPAEVLHLGAVFQAMSDAVVQVKVKNSMFERLLEDFKFTLDCLKPLVQEIVEHFPKEEILEDFMVDLEKGVELVYKCSKGSLRSWFKKYEYVNNLFELDESLQRLFNTLRLQLENDVKEALVLISILEKEIEEIEGSGLLQQYQYESTAAEPQSPKVELDVMNMQVTRDANDEVGVERIEGSSLPQDQIEVAVAEHPSPTIALDQVNIRETSDSKINMEVGVERIEGQDEKKTEKLVPCKEKETTAPIVPVLAARKRQASLEIVPENYEPNYAATLIQTALRRYLTRKSRPTMKIALKSDEENFAATLIQTALRRYLTRKSRRTMKIALKFDEENYAATLIQTAFWRYLARKRTTSASKNLLLAFKNHEERNAATCIQKSFRSKYQQALVPVQDQVRKKEQGLQMKEAEAQFVLRRSVSY